jgi:hypothetical protein
MDALLKQARGAVRAYLAALVDDGQDIVSFTRSYRVATEACAQAGLTLGQLRMQLLKGGAK